MMYIYIRIFNTYVDKGDNTILLCEDDVCHLYVFWLLMWPNVFVVSFHRALENQPQPYPHPYLPKIWVLLCVRICGAFGLRPVIDKYLNINIKMYSFFAYRNIRKRFWMLIGGRSRSSPPWLGQTKGILCVCMCITKIDCRQWVYLYFEFE